MSQKSVLTPESLKEVPLFQGMTTEQLNRIIPLLRPRLFQADDVLLQPNRPSSEAFIIVNGTVRVVHEPGEGKRVILAILGKGQILGEMNFMDSQGPSASVIAQELTRTLAINREAFWQCLRDIPTMSYELAEILSRRMRVANAHIAAMATLDVRQRIARHLITFAEEYGEQTIDGGVRIPFRLTQQDLADLVGATRIHVNMVLSNWKKGRYYSTDADGRITLYEMDKVRNLLPTEDEEEE